MFHSYFFKYRASKKNHAAVMPADTFHSNCFETRAQRKERCPRLKLYDFIVAILNSQHFYVKTKHFEETGKVTVFVIIRYESHVAKRSRARV